MFHDCACSNWFMFEVYPVSCKKQVNSIATCITLTKPQENLCWFINFGGADGKNLD